jgi:hypothetical protein
MTEFVKCREFFSEAERLSPVWMVRKGGRAAECPVWTHPLGLELRLSVGDDLLRSEVIRDQDALIRVQETWRQALEAKGWAK